MSADIKRLRAAAAARATVGDVRIGSIVEVRDGRPWVAFEGGPPAPVLARVALAGPRKIDDESLPGTAVLVLLENGDPLRPLLVGFVSDTLPPLHSQQSGGGPAPGSELKSRTLLLEGAEEVVLRCGQASITLRADGQVIVKGTRLTSRASETNKIRGASVLIN